ncbi:hypothetical protein [Streptomyces sp. NPDC057696]|uniref:hypothetical protein n=1 Tax=Streptomyces sp. NPDC057696 TaxID=3346218 RepID=UPI00367EAC75
MLFVPAVWRGSSGPGYAVSHAQVAALATNAVSESYDLEFDALSRGVETSGDRRAGEGVGVVPDMGRTRTRLLKKLTDAVDDVSN